MFVFMCMYAYFMCRHMRIHMSMYMNMLTYVMIYVCLHIYVYVQSSMFGCEGSVYAKTSQVSRIP